MVQVHLGPPGHTPQALTNERRKGSASAGVDAGLDRQTAGSATTSAARMDGPGSQAPGRGPRGFGPTHPDAN
jgi:hypothetical protein